MVISGKTGCYYITVIFVDGPTVFVLLKNFKDMRGLDKKEGIYRKEIPIVILLLSGINKKCKRPGKN